jgi:tRNA (guanine-N7-)-methyltransferase
VLRQGRMTKAQEKALEVLWPLYGLTPEQGLFDFRKIFNRDAKTIMEIGFGMGDALVEMAKNNPDVNFIGIDVHQPGIGSCLRGIHAAGLQNVRIICGDAVEVLKNHIADHTLDAVHIFFPDPWPKKRHHKRRLIQPSFIELLAHKLKKRGILHLATDWKPYAEHMRTVISAHPGFEGLSPSKEYIPPRPITKFERKAIQEGRTIQDLVFASWGRSQ